jgi:competence protein ComEC
VAVAAGVVAAANWHGSPVRHLVLRGVAAVVLVAPAAVHFVHRRTRASAAALGASDCALLAALAAAGTVAYDAHHRLAARTDASLLPRGVPVTLSARVVEVRPSASGTTRVVVAPRRARLSPGTEDAPAGGLVWASWPDGQAPPARGDEVEVVGALEDPRGRRNPGAFDFASYLRHRRILTVMRCDSARTLREARGVGRLQRAIAGIVERRLPGEPGTLMLGLLLGRTGELPDDLMEAFRRSGTVHVLSVSGLHVGFVLLIAHALLRSARVPPRAARLLSLPCVTAFTFLIGPGPPVLRSTVMAVVVILSGAMERAGSTLNAVGVAAIVLLSVDPGCALDLGFQLSYAATLGIVLLYGPLRSALPPLGGRVGARWTWLRDALLLSSAAQAASTPTLISVAGQVSVAAPLANLVVVPASTFAVASGMAMLAADRVPVLGSVFAGSAWASLELIERAARLTGDPAWSCAPVAARFAPAAFLGVVGLALGLRDGRSRAVGIALAAAALALVAALAFVGPGRDRARAVFFDVGQGDATLLELPGRRYVLVDAGPAAPWTRSDAGRAVIVPYLRKGAVTRLEALVLTHGHDDHTGGALAVIAQAPPRTLVLPRGWEGSPELARAADAARRAGARVVAVARGDPLAFSGADSVVVLAPPRGSPAKDGNDSSVVLLVRAGAARVLLAGDAGVDVERTLLGPGAGVHADLLKVGHHGSATSSSAAFLGRVTPVVAVVSVGERNRFGHPSAGALERLEASGAKVMRTDLDGAVVVELRWDSLSAAATASDRTVAVPVQGTRERDGPTTTSE